MNSDSFSVEPTLVLVENNPLYGYYELVVLALNQKRKKKCQKEI